MEEIKKFSITIEPAFVGNGKNKRLETIIFARVLNEDNKTFNETQGIVPPNGRLEQEIKKIIKLSTNIKKTNGKNGSTNKI